MIDLYEDLHLHLARVYLLFPCLGLPPSRCKSYPPRIVIIYAGYILSLLFLFAKFYVSSYTKKPTGSGNRANGAKSYKSA